jgi:hypothetical protein
MSARHVLVLVDHLPQGLAINAGAILGVSLGAATPGLVGHDAADSSGLVHPGLTTRTLPVLKVDAVRMAALLAKARAHEAVHVIDVTETAQRARTYDEYTTALSKAPTDDHPVLAAALTGPDAAIRSLTGDLPLYR